MSTLLGYSKDLVENATPDQIAKKTGFIKNQKRDFNQAMAKRVFGYQTKGASDKRWTVQAMSNEMKIFCDQKLLENKYSDQFDLNAPLVEIWKKVAIKYPAIDR